MAENSFGKPYKIIANGSNWEVRLFPNEDPTQLFWHRDAEDRTVYLLDGNVKIQLDDELPVQMEIGKPIKIPKNVYHRVIATGVFVLEILK